MDLHRAKMLIMALASVTVLLITLAFLFKNYICFMAGLLAFLLLMLVWLLFNRCPHCGKHLGEDTGIYCPHCGKKL